MKELIIQSWCCSLWTLTMILWISDLQVKTSTNYYWNCKPPHLPNNTLQWLLISLLYNWGLFKYFAKIRSLHKWLTKPDLTFQLISVQRKKPREAKIQDVIFKFSGPHWRGKMQDSLPIPWLIFGKRDGKLEFCPHILIRAGNQN